jgi:chromosome segregation ATPase
MKAFAFLLILMGAGFAVYEYVQLHQQANDYQQQLGALTANLDKLTADNQKLMDEKAVLTRNLADLEARKTELTSQIQAVSASTPPAPPSPAH